MPENVFADEWRECLEAHYMHVIRTKDRVTEPSLTVVMGQAGFNKSELAELRVRATMHIDQSGEDFVPDQEVMDAVAHVEAEGRIFPAAVPDVAPPAEEVPVIEPEQLIEEVAEDAAVEAELLDAEAPANVLPVIEDELPVDQLIEEIEEAALEDERLDEEPPPESPPEDPDAPQQLTLF